MVGSEDETTTSSPARLTDLLTRVPSGWTEVRYAGRRWGLTRTDHAAGGLAIFAEELGGSGRVSANVYPTRRGPVLRPCEMPAGVVLDFLRDWRPVADPPTYARARLAP